MVELTGRRVIREPYLVDAARGKDTLDVGCVAADGLMSLHRRIRAVAKSCLGLDMVQAEGVVKGDAQNFDFPGRFELIIASEVIEHLPNPRGLLESAARSLQPGGRFLLTTPNPYALLSLRRAAFGRAVPNDRFHISMFDPTVFKNLIEVFASELFGGTITYYDVEEPGSLTYKLNKAASALVPAFSCGILADLRRL